MQTDEPGRADEALRGGSRAAAGASALPPVRQWRLHLGAHKTATTHLQQTLAAIRPDLAARGLDALPVAPVRGAWHQHMRRYLRRRNLSIWLRRAPMAAPLQASLAPIRLGPDRVLISEENLPGEADAAARVPPYPDLWRRLRLLNALARGAEIELFLAIRSMDRFLPSAHAEAVRHFPRPQGFAPVARAAVAKPPRWTAMIARIRRAMPGARLTVWRYEDYRAHGHAIMEALTGLALPPLPTIPVPPATVSPSAAAVAAAEALPDDLLYAARAARVAEIYAATPISDIHPAYRPFEPGEAEALAACYAEDCAALDAAGLLIRP